MFKVFLIHSPAEDLLIKKTQLSASSVGREITPTIYQVLTHMRYTYFVRPLYLLKATNETKLSLMITEI
jgi:hypothetical protein